MQLQNAVFFSNPLITTLRRQSISWSNLKAAASVQSTHIIWELEWQAVWLRGAIFKIFHTLLVINERLFRQKNFCDTDFLWGCRIKVEHFTGAPVQNSSLSRCLWNQFSWQNSSLQMNYLLVNGATEINQKWGAAESMGQWKHSSQEEQSDGGEEGRFKAACLINLHTAPIQRRRAVRGKLWPWLCSRKVFKTGHN